MVRRGAAMSYCKRIERVMSEVSWWLCWVACSDDRERVHETHSFVSCEAVATCRGFSHRSPLKVLVPLEDFWIC